MHMCVCVCVVYTFVLLLVLGLLLLLLLLLISILCSWFFCLYVCQWRRCLEEATAITEGVDVTLDPLLNHTEASQVLLHEHTGDGNLLCVCVCE